MANSGSSSSGRIPTSLRLWPSKPKPSSSGPSRSSSPDPDKDQPYTSSDGSFHEALAGHGFSRSGSEDTLQMGPADLQTELNMSGTGPLKWADEEDNKGSPVKSFLAFPSSSASTSKSLRSSGQSASQSATSNFFAFPAPSPDGTPTPSSKPSQPLRAPRPHYQRGHSRTSSLPQDAMPLGGTLPSRTHRRPPQAWQTHTVRLSGSRMASAAALAAATPRDDAERSSNSNTTSSAESSAEAQAKLATPLPRSGGLRTRSLQGLKDLAASFIPGSGASTPHLGDSEEAPAPPPNLLRNSLSYLSLGLATARGRRSSAASPDLKGAELAGEQPPAKPAKPPPPRLSKKRLDKAVSLAVEAAQATGAEPVSTVKKAQPLSGLGLDLDDVGSPGDVEEVREPAQVDGNASPAGRPRSTSRSESSETEDEDGLFAIDLYISSLSYLVSSLPSRDAANLPAAHKAELARVLTDGLRNLGCDVRELQEQVAAADEEKEVLRDEIEALQHELEELRNAQPELDGIDGTIIRRPADGELSSSPASRPGQPSVVHHYVHFDGKGNTPQARAQWRAAAESAATGRQVSVEDLEEEMDDEGPVAASSSRRGPATLAGALGNSALDFSLSVGAGALAAASKGISYLAAGARSRGPSGATTPVVEPSSGADVGSPEALEHAAWLEAELEEELEWRSKQRSKRTSSRRSDNAQWDLSVTMARAAASALYSSLSAVVEQRGGGGGGSDDEGATGRTRALVPRRVASTNDLELTSKAAASGDAKALAARAKGNTPEDRLLDLTASLARSLKRSPLPSQASALASQLTNLMAALDERYSLRRTAADAALKQTASALKFVRRHELHVKAVRVAWSCAEMAVTAVEAYRDESGWAGGEEMMRRGIEGGGNKSRKALTAMSDEEVKRIRAAMAASTDARGGWSRKRSVSSR